MVFLLSGGVVDQRLSLASNEHAKSRKPMAQAETSSAFLADSVKLNMMMFILYR